MSKVSVKLDKLSKSDQSLWAMRHSTEHVLTQAMLNLFPGLLMAMGPATDDGFYFDFEYDKSISESDFPKIESEMQKIIKSDLPFEKEEIDIQDAKKLFSGNPYKQEWLEEIKDRGEKATIFRTGDKFMDLCSGPHVTSTGKIGAFKLLSVAGAYWRGSEKNKMLTRIYGTAFPSQEALDEYLEKLELVKQHDHRKIGKELELYTLNDKVGQGLILWLPKGNIIKEELENWVKKIESEWGYQRVTTPHITKAGLYYTSGHLPYYKDDMYPPMKSEGEEDYYLKPMNCPHHHMIYASKLRSYRELPLRLAEFGTCYRHEASGELFGIMRVRGFTQNDAHIYCTEKQAVDEFISVMKLHELFYKTLGIEKYHLELSLRDPKNKKKYHGDEKIWIKAEKLMREAIKKVNIPMVEKIGGAAFYGPKIDFIIESSIGREFAISTNQIDLFMGNAFKLKYVDDKGEIQTPVIIHRAPLGSHERFVGFLTEHYGGNFPVWLAPTQVVILPITQDNNNYADSIAEKLKSEGIRFEVDSRNETLQAKIRDAQIQRVPFMFIVGKKEADTKSISLRTRAEANLGQKDLSDTIKMINKMISDKLLSIGN